MNATRQHLLRASLLTGVFALTAPQAALALTAACTKIDNRATVTYSVATVSQTPIDSKNGNNGNADEATSFYVGVKVDVTVVKTENALATLTYAPGATNATMNFTIANNGNATMIYDLTAANLGNGTASPAYSVPPPHGDSFNATIASVNGTAGPIATTAAIAPSGTLVVPVVVTIPSAQVNNDLSVWSLIAQSKFPGTGTISVTTKNSTAKGDEVGGLLCNAVVPLATTNIDIVVRDGNGTDTVATDYGQSSDRNAILVTAAGLTISKSSTVYWDPINLFVAPKAIPGAIVTYTVNIANAVGAATATNIQVVDSLDALIVAGQVIFGGAIAGMFDNSNDVGGITCPAGSGIWIQGALPSPCRTNAYELGEGASFHDPADPATGGFNNRVVALVPSVAGGADLSVKYQVLIQ